MSFASRITTGHLTRGTFAPVTYTSPGNGDVLDLSAAIITIHLSGQRGARLSCALWFEDFHDTSAGLSVVGALTSNGIVLDDAQEHAHADVLTALVRTPLSGPDVGAAILTNAVNNLETVITGHGSIEQDLARNAADLRLVHAAVSAPTPGQRSAALAVVASGYEGSAEALLAAVDSAAA